MAYIGNTVQNQGFAPAIDYFNGNGVTVTFTLSRPVASVAQVIVAVDNVIQNPSSAFGVVGNSITFTSAPLSGTNNIWVEYTSLITTYQGISQDPTVIGDIRATGGYLAEGDFGNSFVDGNLIDYVTGRGRFTVGELDDITFYHGGTSGRSAMMDLYYAGGAKVYGTTALTIPVGTTGERPGTPANGMIRFNSTTGSFEVYNGTAWIQVTNTNATSVEYLVVAGGAGGGYQHGGGGGAGGFRTDQIAVAIGTTYTVTVGAGGAGASGGNGTGTPGGAGSNSVFGSIISTGGGGGGSYPSYTGLSGGSGGGGGSDSGAGGAGTAGQGNNGGNGAQHDTGGGGGGGGGGAGAVGGNAVAGGSGGAGDGGAGRQSNIDGNNYYYAGGGGGGTIQAGSLGAGDGGIGGGGGGGNAGGTSIGGIGGGSARNSGANGGRGSGSAATGGAGGANTGGGGGSAGAFQAVGGQGGSGIVIIRYPNSFANATTTGSPTFVNSGGFKIYTFTGSGTITF